MAELYYANLGIFRPDITMWNAYRRLGPIHRYLVHAKKSFQEKQFVLKWERYYGEPTSEFAEEIKSLLEETSVNSTLNPEGEMIRLSTEGLSLKEREEDYILDQFLDAEKIWDMKRCWKEDSIKVSDSDSDKNILMVDQLPRGEYIFLRPDTYQLKMQIKALETLQNSPYPAHYPLLRLLENIDFVQWPSFQKENIPEWFRLTDSSRPGTLRQREFVERALGTPDLMILEGPPGSGKTTAITELILQSIKQGKRVLLVASTHVAVDNVLERLLEEKEVIAVRIGDERRVSRDVQHLRLGARRQTDRKRIIGFLRERGIPRTESQNYLLEALEGDNGENVITRIILDSANLVCGTTIGILRHPDIRAAKFSEPPFDIMILDEASKTTFQEFLVPALYARKWIISGDPRQLSPYVEEDIVVSNVEHLLAEEEDGGICLDLFPSKKHNMNLLVVENEEDRIARYREQAAGLGLDIAVITPESEPHVNFLELLGAQVILIDNTLVGQYRDYLPMDIGRIVGDVLLPPSFERRREYRHWKYSRRWTDDRDDEGRNWADEIAWRLIRVHDLRKTPEEQKTYDDDLRTLIPLWYDSSIQEDMSLIKRIALPSVIELLQEGFERQRRDKLGCALSDGLPQPALEPRHILLSYQHRMHSGISEFPRTHIYLNEEGKPQGLLDPDYLDSERDRMWTYPRFTKRSIWIDVKGKKERKRNINHAEVNVLVRELRDFKEWARRNPKSDGSLWEVALLSFYKGQERELSYQMRALFNSPYFRTFRDKRNTIKVEVCTVDRFQGHEADLVFLSFVQTNRVGFLNSLNRLNVAITRPRHQLVLVGDWNFFAKRKPRKHRSKVLLELAEFHADKRDIFYNSKVIV